MSEGHLRFRYNTDGNWCKMPIWKLRTPRAIARGRMCCRQIVGGVGKSEPRILSTLYCLREEYYARSQSGEDFDGVKKRPPVFPAGVLVSLAGARICLEVPHHER